MDQQDGRQQRPDRRMLSGFRGAKRQKRGDTPDSEGDVLVGCLVAAGLALLFWVGLAVLIRVVL